MDKTGHLFVGAILGVILIIVTHYFWGWFDFKSLINIGIMVAIIYIYSLLADIDTKSGTIVWTFIPIGLIAAISGYTMNNQIFLIGGLALIGVTFLAAQFLPHRGFTHSILFGVAVALPWIYFSHEYALLAFVCFYSHLIADEEYFKLV
jgi:hypothetical protein